MSSDTVNILSDVLLKQTSVILPECALILLANIHSIGYEGSSYLCPNLNRERHIKSSVTAKYFELGEKTIFSHLTFFFFWETKSGVALKLFDYFYLT